MKTLKSVLAFLSFMGLMLVSCSDQSQSPVSPSNQTITQSNSLDKVFTREFNAAEIPTAIDDPGIYIYPDGKIKLIGNKGPTIFNATFVDGLNPDLLTGPGYAQISGMTDPVAGTGIWQGKLTLTPYTAEGGKWEFTWHGEAAFTATAWNGEPGWIIPLKEEGHGNGGILTGMQCRMELIVTAPPDLSIWAATGHGFVISH